MYCYRVSGKPLSRMCRSIYFTGVQSCELGRLGAVLRAVEAA